MSTPTHQGLGIIRFTKSHYWAGTVVIDHPIEMGYSETDWNMSRDAMKFYEQVTYLCFSKALSSFHTSVCMGVRGGYSPKLT